MRCGQILYHLGRQGSPVRGQHLPAELIGWEAGTQLQQSHSVTVCVTGGSRGAGAAEAAGGRA